MATAKIQAHTLFNPKATRSGEAHYITYVTVAHETLRPCSVHIYTDSCNFTDHQHVSVSAARANFRKMLDAGWETSTRVDRYAISDATRRSNA